MYKAALILYVVCFALYILFSRVPDYFESQRVSGKVALATYSSEKQQPYLVVKYPVGDRVYSFKTSQWLLTKYREGDVVTIIYDPANPRVSSLYSFLGYWFLWEEFLYTSIIFIIFFVASSGISGKSPSKSIETEQSLPKRKYDD